MAVPVNVADTSFDAQVLKCDIPVLADFWAEWCGPCHAIAPHIQKIADKYEGRLKVVKLDIDTNPTVTSSYQVLSIPTLILFKFGQPVERIVGAISEEKIVKAITPYLD